MERYLLFDSGCSLCTALARQVEEAADGKLTARSLRDPDVRSILDETKPGWRWEPMLLEVDGDRRRVHAGIGMRARLVQVLGPRRALRLAQVVQQATAFRPGRRGVLRLAGGLLAGLTLGKGVWRQAHAEEPVTRPTSKFYLPFVQYADLQVTEARKAAQMMLKSDLFARMRTGLLVLQNEKRITRMLPDARAASSLVRVTTEGTEYYASDNLAVGFVGQTADRKLYQVFIGLNEATDKERVILTGFVDTRQGTVLDAVALRFVPQQETPNERGDYRIFSLSRDNSTWVPVEPTGISVGGMGQVILPNESRDISNVPTGCNDSCVCSLVCGSIPIWYCAVIAYLSGGVGGVVCSVVFLVTCSLICQ